MSIPATMKAAVIDGDHLTVKEVPVPEVRDGMVLIKTRAVAGNPTDWKHIVSKIGPQGSISGCDVSGEIVKIGANVDTSKYKIGQKAYGLTHGSSVKHPDNGAFAEYSLLDPKIAYFPNQDITMSGKDTIPEGTVKYFEDGASFPVSLTTAGAVLHSNLGLDLKWEPSEPQRDHPVLFWGGATGVGQLLIQVAKKIHGFTKIVTVASKKHEAQLKTYGADEVFDYHDADVIEQIKKKYPDLQIVVDCVSNENTIKQVYKCATESKSATIVQLTHLSIKDIPEEDRRDNKTIIGSMSYLATGEDVPFGPVHSPADPKFRKDVEEFVAFINPRINEGIIHHIPIKIYKNGLDDVQQILDDIKFGKNSGEKLVAILN